MLQSVTKITINCESLKEWYSKSGKREDHNYVRQWLCLPLVTSLGRQRQADLGVQGYLGIQSKSQGSQGYTEKFCFRKTKINK